MKPKKIKILLHKLKRLTGFPKFGFFVIFIFTFGLILLLCRSFENKISYPHQIAFILRTFWHISILLKYSNYSKVWYIKNESKARNWTNIKNPQFFHYQVLKLKLIFRQFYLLMCWLFRPSFIMIQSKLWIFQ